MLSLKYEHFHIIIFISVLVFVINKAEIYSLSKKTNRKVKDRKKIGTKS